MNSGELNNKAIRPAQRSGKGLNRYGAPGHPRILIGILFKINTLAARVLV